MPHFKKPRFCEAPSLRLCLSATGLELRRLCDYVLWATNAALKPTQQPSHSVQSFDLLERMTSLGFQ